MAFLYQWVFNYQISDMGETDIKITFGLGIHSYLDTESGVHDPDVFEMWIQALHFFLIRESGNETDQRCIKKNHVLRV